MIRADKEAAGKDVDYVATAPGYCMPECQKTGTPFGGMWNK
jgi:hypothetical protein